MIRREFSDQEVVPMKHKLILLMVSLFLTLFISNAEGQEDRSALIRRLQPSIVSIGGKVWDARSRRYVTDYTLGSGFYVDEQRRIVTCYQVINGVEDLTITTVGRHRYKARLIRKHVDSNLALVELTNASGQTVEPLLINLAIPENRTKLFVIGSSFEPAGLVSNGVMSGLRNFGRAPEDDYIGQLLQITMSNSQDSVCGPVVGLNGIVYGLAVSETKRAQKISYAVPGRRLLSFLMPYYEAISLNSPSEVSYFNLGRVYDEMNRYREAESAYRNALTFNRDNARVNSALGVLILLKPGSSDMPQRSPRKPESTRVAIAFLERAVDLDPSNGKAHYNLAAAYFRANERDRAREECDIMFNMRSKKKLPQPVLSNAARLCSWPKAIYSRH
jgi:tetratricopeptide (TPR) repeat protein